MTNPLWLKKITVENLKRFEKLELELEGMNLLVGPNNCGKTTALQACALFNFCYQACLEKKNGKSSFKNHSYNPDEFFTVPVSDIKDLWLNKRVQYGQNAVPIRIRGELFSGAVYEFELVLQFYRLHTRAVSKTPPLDSSFGISLIPGYTGFWPREERRTPAVRNTMRSQAQHGGIIRNLLLDLKENPRQWEQFKSVLTAIFPSIHLLDPAFDETVDHYIKVGYKEDPDGRASAAKTAHELDLFSGGSGFHQFVQILAGILIEESTTVLLDEPDAHLFSRLQYDLYSVMEQFTQTGVQIIAATHSTELISSAKPNQLITFANGKPRRLEVAQEALNVVSSLGGLENLSLILIDAYSKVIIVENKADENYIRFWMRRVLGSDKYSALRQKLVFLHCDGRPSGDKVRRMLDTLKQAFRSTKPLTVKAFVIADRDYATDELRAEELNRYKRDPFSAEQLWHIWERTEIENYMLFPEAITASIGTALADFPLLKSNIDAIKGVVESFVEESKKDFRIKMINKFGEINKETKAGWEPATVTLKAEEFVNEHWKNDERYYWCDAKETVLPRLRDKIQSDYHVHLSDEQIINSVDDSQVPEEMKQIMKKLSDFLADGET